MLKAWVQDLESRCLSWHIWVGPKCNHMCCYKSQAERALRRTHRGKGHVKTRGRSDEVTWLHHFSHTVMKPPLWLQWWSHKRLEAGRDGEGVFPGASRRSTLPADILISHFWPPGLGEITCQLFGAAQFVVICYSSPRTWTLCTNLGWRAELLPTFSSNPTREKPGRVGHCPDRPLWTLCSDISHRARKGWAGLGWAGWGPWEHPSQFDFLSEPWVPPHANVFSYLTEVSASVGASAFCSKWFYYRSFPACGLWEGRQLGARGTREMLPWWEQEAQSQSGELWRPRLPPHSFTEKARDVAWTPLVRQITQSLSLSVTLWM